MTASIRLPRPGERVKFHDGEQISVGICNGEPKHYSESMPETSVKTVWWPIHRTPIVANAARYAT